MNKVMLKLATTVIAVGTMMSVVGCCAICPKKSCDKSKACAEKSCDKAGKTCSADKAKCEKSKKCEKTCSKCGEIKGSDKCCKDAKGAKKSSAK